MKNSMLIIFGFLAIICMSFAPTSGELFSTSLKITVLDELGNTVEGAQITLYKNDEDYRNETNAIDSALTDKKGRVTFKDLEPTIYFVNAEKGSMNNYGAGIQTGTLVEGRINKVNIVIE